MDAEVFFTEGPVVPPPRTRELHRQNEVGAIIEFHGIVRATEGDAQLDGLFYEAYEPMARREFDHIIADIAARLSTRAVCIVHSTGFVPVGAASLYVRVEAKHRGAALAFCGELIDRMKRDVPIWKTARRRAASPLAQ